MGVAELFAKVDVVRKKGKELNKKLNQLEKLEKKGEGTDLICIEIKSVRDEIKNNLSALGVSAREIDMYIVGCSLNK